MKTFSNDSDEPIEIPYTDAAGHDGVMHVGPGGVVQVDDTDPCALPLVEAYTAALTEVD